MVKSKSNLLHILAIIILVNLFISSLLYLSIDSRLENSRTSQIQTYTINVNESQDSASAVFEATKNSIVYVSSTFNAQDILNQDSTTQGGGSGFIVSSDGIIYTNSHVVENAEEITVTLADGTELPARLIGIDQITDIAVLRVIHSSPLASIVLGDSSSIEPGQTVIAIGNPYRLTNTVTQGIVSAINRTLEPVAGYTITDVIQTDAAINPGNSGGPLLNARGEVIGITNAKLVGNIAQGGAEGLGFAIPINTAKEIADELIQNGHIARPWMGISGLDITRDRAEQLEIPLTDGVIIREIVDNSPADKAGLRATQLTDERDDIIVGDVITKYNDKPIKNTNDLINAIRSSRVNDRITLTIYRDGDIRTVDLRLEERPQNLSQ